jgi:hypothetical protein
MSGLLPLFCAAWQVGTWALYAFVDVFTQDGVLGESVLPVLGGPGVQLAKGIIATAREMQVITVIISGHRQFRPLC